jgi:hypothetical protein
MMVARQFIAWNRFHEGHRPGGYGMSGSERRATIRAINQPGWGSDRSLPVVQNSGIIVQGALSYASEIIWRFTTTI